MKPLNNDIDSLQLESISDLLTEASITCPYCWESIDVVIDHTAGESRYVEDCQVCCQPIVISFSLNDGELDIQADREND